MQNNSNNLSLEAIARKVKEIKEPVTEFYRLFNLKKEIKVLKNMETFGNVEYMPTPFDIAKFYKIEYIFEKVEGYMPAFLTRSPDIIHISDKYTAESYEARILCAHELGHYFLHEGQEYAMNNDILNRYLPEETIAEYEANVFSIYLMPQIMGERPWGKYPIKKLNRIVYHKTIKRDG